MTFVSDVEQRSGKPPVDYVVTLKEDLHVNAIVQDMAIADAFSVGNLLLDIYHSILFKHLDNCVSFSFLIS